MFFNLSRLTINVTSGECRFKPESKRLSDPPQKSTRKKLCIPVLQLSSTLQNNYYRYLFGAYVFFGRD